MDSNEDETQTMRAEELSKMRSNSSSPSNLSVASSGSPLVRDQSSAGGQANKRPAPTSIAAAQLEFVNKMQANQQSGRSSDLATKKSQQQQEQRQQKLKLQQSKMQMVIGSSQVVVGGERIPGDDERMKKKKKTTTTGKIKERQSGGEADKSFGYVFAKSIAFRAHRFNEFWTVNKMRFMNLACLLMILSCLATILLFTGNSDEGTGLNLRKSPLLSANIIDGESESVESLESQPLQSKQPLEDSSPPLDQIGAKFKRKSSSEIGGKSSDQSQSSDSPSLLSELFGQPTVERRPMQSSSSSLFVDPVLSQILNDLESGSLFKTIKRAAAESNGTGSIFNRPIIRRNKNGATIIISSGGFGNDSSGKSQRDLFQLPSLLEKILPAMLKSSLASSKSAGLEGASLDKNDSARNALFADQQIPLATATITIGNGNLFGSSAAPLMSPLMSRPPTMSPFSPADPFMSFARPRAYPRMFIAGNSAEPLLAGSFGPFATLAAPAMPPAGLLSMILRSATAGQSADDLDDLSPFRPAMLESFNNGRQKQPIEAAANQPTSQAGNSSSTNEAQTKQTILAATNASASAEPQNKPADSDPIKPADSAPQSASANDSAEVELFDVGRHLARQVMNSDRLHQLQARSRPSANSMLIFGSDSPQAEASAFQLAASSMPFGPFMHSPVQHQPHMILMGEDGASMGPILRSILGNVMVGVATDGGDNEGKASETIRRRHQQRQAQGSSAMPDWSSLTSEIEEELAGLGGSDAGRSSSWDEPALAGRNLHRSAASDFYSSTTVDASELVANIQQLESEQQPSGGFVSGTIRQTIRGPGMDVERIIELPSSGVLAQRAVHQVGPGIRSQSLSRMDASAAINADEDEDGRGEMSILPASHFHQQSSSALPANGFFGRLLSDLARRADSPPSQHSNLNQFHHRGRAQAPAGLMKNHRSASFINDDLEDLDVEGDSGELQHEEKEKPKRRPNSGWIRLRAPGSERRSDSELARDDEDEPASVQHRHRDDLPGLPVFVEPRRQQQATADQNSIANESVGKRETDIWRARPVPSNPSSALPANARQLEPIKLAANNIGLRHQQQQQPAAAAAAAGANRDNPFTSPSSPLFGFPSSAASAAASLAAAAASPGPKATQTSNRQQRSFVYHSNHEIAPHHQQQQQQQPAPALSIQERSEDRSEQQQKQNDDMIAATFQPAGIVMGRRLDDEPSHVDQESQLMADQEASAAPLHLQSPASDNHYHKGL